METRIERLCGMAGLVTMEQSLDVVRTRPDDAGAAPLMRVLAAVKVAAPLP